MIAFRMKGPIQLANNYDKILLDNILILNQSLARMKLA